METYLEFLTRAVEDNADAISRCSVIFERDLDSKEVAATLTELKTRQIGLLRELERMNSCSS